MLSVRRAICEAGGGGRSYQISIHTLREEGDLELERGLLRFKLFLPTPSARRATGKGVLSASSKVISIHALREEGDAQRRKELPPGAGISIHALREEGDSRTVLLP